jgi:HNH endonuclease
LAISPRTRYEVLLRDRFTCGYCGRCAPDVVLHVDHVIPRAAGGGDQASNLVTACESCNGGKSDLPPPEWLVTKIKRVQREWAKNGQSHSGEDDLTDMYVYLAAFDYLAELPTAQVLSCISHAGAKSFPFRPGSSDLIIAAAALAKEGYGAVIEGVPF